LIYFIYNYLLHIDKYIDTIVRVMLLSAILKDTENSTL